MSKLRFILAPLCLLLFIGSSAQADLLACYDFEPNQTWEGVYQNTYGLSASHDNHGDSAASFYETRSGSFTANDAGVTPNVQGYANHAFASSTNTLLDSNPAGMNYHHEFTMSITNNEYTLDDLSFDYWVNNTPNIGDFSVSVYSNLTGYSMGSELINYQYSKQTAADVEVQNVSISNLEQIAAFQNLAAGDQVQFRLVFNDNFPAGFVHRVDNVKLTADRITSVPEPGSIAFLMMASIAGFATRRRR